VPSAGPLPEGKRQELIVGAVTDVRIAINGDLVEIELIPAQENTSRIWFKLFRP